MDMETATSMVLETIQSGSSQNQENFKPAEKKLQEWEIEPGFYSILWKIFNNPEVDVNARWLALLYFKNGVDKYWRPNAPNALSEEEKTKLRQELLANFHEPINPLATQLAVVISKVARLDCPNKWPALVPSLLTAVGDSNSLVQHRALLTLHHVVKTLSSKRLPGDRRRFQDLAENIYSPALALWNTHTELFLQQCSENYEAAIPSLEKAVLALKILKNLTVFGFLTPNQSENVVAFLEMIFDRAKIMLECRKQMKHRKALCELIEKYIINLTKVLMCVLETHPFSFVKFLEKTLQFCVCYTLMFVDEEVLFERFKLQCLNILRIIISCSEYKVSSRVIASGAFSNALCAHQIKKSFFTPEILTAICQGLVGLYFLLTQEDLQQWDEDPEAFATEEIGETGKYCLRPCAESLFTKLFPENREILTPVLIAMLHANTVPVPSDDLDAILAKDAVYNAVGLLSFELFDEINFDSWYVSTLRTELQMQGGHLRVLRRRIVWLLGKWVGVGRLSSDFRPMVYSDMMSLLQPNEDIVVRLAVPTALKEAIDDFDFNKEQFLEFLEPIISLLFNLLKDCKECDSKMLVLNVMSFVVERVGNPIRPYVSNLIQYLPLAWNESGDHNMLRCTIVATLIQIVKAMGTDSKVLHSFLIPVIDVCTDMQQDCHVYLLEDGLALWDAVIVNATEMTDDLMRFFQRLPTLLEATTENLCICLAIAKKYLVLSPQIFLQVHGETMLKSCQYMLTDLLPKGIFYIMQYIELCLRVASDLSCELYRSLIPQIMIESREAVDENYSFQVHCIYDCIIARVLLFSKDTFNLMLREAAQKVGETEDHLMSQLLEGWVRRVEAGSWSLSHGLEKIVGLTLSSLLSGQSSFLMNNCNKIIRTVVAILHDVTKPDESGICRDVYSYDLDSFADHYYGDDDDGDGVDTELRYSEHHKRMRELDSSDIVYKVDLIDYFRAAFYQLKNQVGHEQFMQICSTLDSETVSSLQEFLGDFPESSIETCFTAMKLQ